MEPFHPVTGSTVSLSASASSSRVALGGMPKSGRFQVRIHNAASVAVFVAFGTSSVAATTSDMPIPANGVEVFTLNSTDKDPVTHMAGITSSGSGTVYSTTGEGI